MVHRAGLEPATFWFEIGARVFQSVPSRRRELRQTPFNSPLFSFFALDKDCGNPCDEREISRGTLSSLNLPISCLCIALSHSPCDTGASRSRNVGGNAQQSSQTAPRPSSGIILFYTVAPHPSPSKSNSLLRKDLPTATHLPTFGSTVLLFAWLHFDGCGNEHIPFVHALTHDDSVGPFDGSIWGRSRCL